MKVEIERIDEAFRMKAVNPNGIELFIDSSVENGGKEAGYRPMQLLLAGIGGCSGIDLISILKKQKQTLRHLRIIVEGEREKDKIPSLFSKIHLHFVLSGNLDDKKVQQALSLSLDKYCSVAKILEKTAEIAYTYEIKKEKI